MEDFSVRVISRLNNLGLRERKLSRRIVSELTLTLLLVSMLTLVFNIQPVKASGTIYIRPDGTVYPSTSPISRVGDVYTFTDDIHETIVVERDNIIIDGNSCKLQGSGTDIGLDLSYRHNVTVKNTIVTWFEYGVWLEHSNNSRLIGNTVSNSVDGIYISSSNNNVLEGNVALNNLAGTTITYSNNNMFIGNFLFYNSLFGLAISFSSNNTGSINTFSNNWAGIVLEYSSFNRLTGNIVSDNIYGIVIPHSNNNTVCLNFVSDNYYYGIGMFSSTDNVLFRNSFSYNWVGIWLSSSSNNKLHHNLFIHNTRQVYDKSWDYPSIIPSKNVWDDGYSSGGNYWSDYNGTDLFSGSFQNETGGDGIGDTPYVIDENNRDRYPLIHPYGYVPSPDLNDDGKVDIEDISTAALAFGSYPSHPRWKVQADINKDSKVDIRDIVLIAKNFGKTRP